MMYNRKTVQWAGLCALMIPLFFMACRSSPYFPSTTPSKWANTAYTGEGERILEGTAWELPFLSEAERPIVGEFHRDGRIGIRPSSSMLKGISTWERTGDTVKFVFADGKYFYEGTYYPGNNRISGTLYLSDGQQFDFTMEPEGSFKGFANSSSGTGRYYLMNPERKAKTRP
jgi:hypothetical protein